MIKIHLKNDMQVIFLVVASLSAEITELFSWATEYREQGVGSVFRQQFNILHLKQFLWEKNFPHANLIYRVESTCLKKEVEKNGLQIFI